MTNQTTFILNTKNHTKKTAVEEVLRAYLKENFSLIVKDLPINFPETPKGKQTYQGAKRRAEKIFKDYNQKIIAVGLESGLVKRFGILFEEAWCCIIFKKNYFFGYSSGLEIPKEIQKRLAKEKHKDIMLKLEKRINLSSKDTWGIYTNGLLPRKESLKEAFRNAFLSLLKNIK